MSMNYKNWQMLNESLNFPLGISNPTQIKLLGDVLAEKSKEEKVVDEKSDDDDKEESKDGDKKANFFGKKDKKEDKKDNKKEDKKDSNDCDEKMDDKKPAGKLPPWLKPKPDINEVLKSYQNVMGPESVELGTPEYAERFFNSLKDLAVDPYKKWSSGINLGEEVLLPPSEGEVSADPAPGDVGYAPVAPIFANGQTSYTGIEGDFKPFDATAVFESYLAEKGILEEYKEWKKSQGK